MPTCSGSAISGGATTEKFRKTAQTQWQERLPLEQAESLSQAFLSQHSLALQVPQQDPFSQTAQDPMENAMADRLKIKILFITMLFKP